MLRMLSIILLTSCLLGHGSAAAQERRLTALFEAAHSSASDLRAAEEAVIMASPQELELEADDYVDLLVDIGDRRLSAGQPGEAARAFSRALSVAESGFGETAFELRGILRLLAASYAQTDDLATAERLLLRSVSIAERELGPANPSLREEYDALASLPTPRMEGAERAARYRTKEQNLKQRAELERGEDFLALGPSAGEVDQCRDAAMAQNAYERIEVYYGTTRKRSEKDTPERFYLNAPDIENGTKFGSVYVTVPCERDLGAIPRTRWWRGSFRPDKARHMVLEDLRTFEDPGRFWSSVAERIRGSGRKEALVFFHGYKADFKTAALRTAALAADLELDGAPLFYDWPSRAKLTGYLADRELATSQSVARDAAAFLHAVATRSGAEKVSIIAHSMGNEPLLRALEELADNQFAGVERVPFEEVIFAAPDVELNNFRQLVSETGSLGARMTLYASSRDKALKFSSWQSSFRRAGETTSRIVLDGLETVDTSLASMNFVGHDDFAGTGLDDLRGVVWHSLSPRSRCVLRKGAQDQEGLWIFKPRCAEAVFRASIIALRNLGYDAAVDFAETQAAGHAAADNPDQAESWRAVAEELRGMSVVEG